MMEAKTQVMEWVSCSKCVPEMWDVYPVSDGMFTAYAYFHPTKGKGRGKWELIPGEEDLSGFDIVYWMGKPLAPMEI